MKVNQFPDRIININNKDYLYFGGTSYLGLPTNKQFQELVVKNILRWGTTYGSSRNANIKLTAYDDGENFLAKHIKSESAVTVSSGMLAGKLVIDVLQNDSDCFFHFADIHPAIKKKGSLPVLINGKLNPKLLDSEIEKVIILADGMPSFETSPTDLTILNQISKNKKITLVVDESHSLGILGDFGCGIFSDINLNIERKIMVSSLGKAFGLTGGVIASDSIFINEIKKLDTFISAAGMNPAFVQTLAEASKIYKNQHQKLIENLNYIGENLSQNQLIKFNKSYPLIYVETEEINDKLNINDIIIANFKYQENKKSLNRIVITANHTKEDLNKLIEVLNNI